MTTLPASDQAFAEQARQLPREATTTGGPMPRTRRIAIAALAAAGTMLVGLAGGGQAASVPSVPYSPFFERAPLGEAPCAEGMSRARTLYSNGFESSIPNSRFNDGFTRSSTARAVGSYSARSGLYANSTDHHFFLPYVKSTSGWNTRFAFAAYTNGRGIASVNSQAQTISGSGWRGYNLDVTPATHDEGGWLGSWFEHYPSSSTTSVFYVDNVQVFQCGYNKTTRVSGTYSYEFAAQVSKAFAASPDVVYVLAGTDQTDSLALPALAALGRPSLLVTATSIPTATQDALTRLKPAKIVVVGPTSRVSDTVAQQLGAYAPTVERVSGTAAGMAGQLAVDSYPTGGKVYLVDNRGIMDAYSAGALAARTNSPVLVTSSTSLSSETRDALSRLKPSQVVVVGDTTSVSESVRTAAAAYATGSTKSVRIGSAGDYTTNATVAAQFPAGTPSNLVPVAAWQQAFVGALRAAHHREPLLFANETGLYQVTYNRLVAMTEPSGTVIGNLSFISSLTRDVYGRTLR
ncbi:cell wall-binding repeat-containing protein [Actinomycetota bacterium]